MKPTRVSLVLALAALLGTACKKEAPPPPPATEVAPTAEPRRAATARGHADRARQLGRRRQAGARAPLELRREGQHHRVGLHREHRARRDAHREVDVPDRADSRLTSQTVAASPGVTEFHIVKKSRLACRTVQGRDLAQWHSGRIAGVRCSEVEWRIRRAGAPHPRRIPSRAPPPPLSIPPAACHSCTAPRDRPRPPHRHA